MFANLLSVAMILSGNALIDQDLDISIDSLQPHQNIEVEAEAFDENGVRWKSLAYFKADQDGAFHLETAVPLPGSSYEKADASGLFWSMLPTDNSDISFLCNDKFSVGITLKSDDQVLLAESVTRIIKTSNVQTIEVRENGLIGNLYLPPSEHPLPIIITLSGSEGKTSDCRSKLLASHGFAVLALGYFGLEGLPYILQDIPLEYFQTAFAWLKNQQCIDSSRIGLYGVSRGAELSLILGTLFSDSIQTIVAVAPSSAIYGVFGPTPTHAWLYHGMPLAPFATTSPPDFTTGHSSSNPMVFRQNFIDGMKDPCFEKATISVEKIRCPILLVSGGDDQVWPSDLYAIEIMKRAQNCKHLHYPDAGHGIHLPNLPLPSPVYWQPYAKMWFSTGGTREANASASRDSWEKIVEFFHESLNLSN